MNIRLAQKVLETLATEGVNDILLCAGARNSPFVVCLERAHGIKIWNFFDERSAGFFALGRAQRDQRPVAIITTSGTAVAELLPAAVEATYTATPLIFVTADRPRDYRGTGAPQAIEQVGIFSQYVETCKDIGFLDEALDLSNWTRRAPLQLNICFSEPLIDEAVPEIDFNKLSASSKPLSAMSPTHQLILEQPMVIAGPLSLDQAEKLAPHLEKLGAPIYAEALSNLRKFSSLQALLLKSGDATVRKIFEKGFCKSVFRIGGVPTLRFWRDLEETFRQMPVFSLSELDYSGLSRKARHVVGLHNVTLFKAQWTEDLRSQALALDKERAQKIEGLVQKYPQSEVGLLRKLAPQLSGQFVYLGNSLPIREWDLVCPFIETPARMSGNRGANGIDGQVSSFLGQAETNKENWALIGDLTALYDLSSLWITPQLEIMKMRLIVINNKGGMIFKNMFEKDIFLNRHQIEFSHWAKMWNWNYEKWEQVPESFQLTQHLVIELVPNAEQSAAFWTEMKSL